MMKREKDAYIHICVCTDYESDAPWTEIFAPLYVHQVGSCVP